jgi:DNA-binding NarL/FixJ family response regulator
MLDTGLPGLNGFEVARRILQLCPDSKVLFVSQESSDDVATEALSTGALGYVRKADARSELLAAGEQRASGQEVYERDIARL